MAAFDTKKSNASLGLQLTFPSVFSEAYKALGRPMQFQPRHLGHLEEYKGDDFYAVQHEARRAEARRMANVKVESTRNAERRMLVSHQNYYRMPAPVLSQRRIGSNFGVGGGANMGYYLPHREAGLEGGVLGSREGMLYGRKLLSKRVAELDAIDQSAIAGPTMQANVESSIGFAEQSKIEIATLINELASSVFNSSDKIDFSTFEITRRLVLLIIRYATSDDSDKTLGTDLQSYIVEIQNLINDLDDELNYHAPEEMLRETRVSKQNAEKYQITIKQLLEKLVVYMKKMFTNVELDVSSRKQLSQSVVKTLGFSKLEKKKGEEGEVLSFKDMDKKATSVRDHPNAVSNAMAPILDYTSYGRFTQGGLSYEVTNGPAQMLPREALEDKNRDMAGRMAYPKEAGTSRNYIDDEGYGPSMEGLAISFSEGAMPSESMDMKRASAAELAREAERVSAARAAGIPESALPAAAALPARAPSSKGMEELARLSREAGAPAEAEMAQLPDAVRAVVDWAADSNLKDAGEWEDLAAEGDIKGLWNTKIYRQGWDIIALRSLYKALSGRAKYPRDYKLKDYYDYIRDKLSPYF